MHVRTLCEEQQIHHVLRSGPGHVPRETHDTLPQAVDNGLALLGYTHTREVFGLGAGLGVLHNHHLCYKREGVLRANVVR